MTAKEFLYLLEAQLQSLTPEERENALNYYREYLEEAGDNVSDAIENLGSPQSVAERILAEVGERQSAAAQSSPYDDQPGTFYSGGTGYQNPAAEDYADVYSAPDRQNTVSVGRILLTVFVLIFMAPIWGTLLILWIALVFSVIAVLAALAFSVVAAPLQGMGYLSEGMTGMGIYDIGAGVFSLGMVLLLWKPVLKLTVGSFKGIGKAAKALVNGLLGRRTAA